MEHPFLVDSLDIPWPELTAERVEPDIRLALERAEAQLQAIRDVAPGEATFANTVLALEAAGETLARPWGLVTHLDSVRSTPALREAHNRLLPEVSDWFSGIPLDAALWRAISAFADSPEARALEGPQRRLLDETLRDFRENGAELAAEPKARLRAVQQELAQLAQNFSENELDATHAYERLIDDAALLDGLPESYQAAARADALAKGHGSEDRPIWRFTLQATSYVPVLRYAHSEALRRELWEAASAIASCTPHDNTPILRRMLALRQEKAELLGQPHFADLVLRRRMAKCGRRALDFVTDLHARTLDAFRAENAELEAFKAQALTTDPAPLPPWDQEYWAERLRRERFDFDEEALRPYYALPKVLSGLFALTEGLFGVRVSERTGEDRPPLWHHEVGVYTLHDAASGQHLGSFYTDWFPREDKRSGAWMNHLITGERGEGGAYTPHLGLMCGNMNRPQGDGPALLTHREVETVFHEFGHLLHHLLGEVPVKSLNGVQVAWDFVELPSQLMENWCWERESLDLFARHHETGEALPAALLEKLRDSRTFHAARAQMRQLTLARMDLELHLHPQPFLDGDLDAAVLEVLEDYLTPSPVPHRPILRRFGHLFADATGYAAAYYSYKWAEVLDADAFTRFLEEGILNPATGQAFRREILRHGNAFEPEVLYRNFRGREPDPQALLRRLGLDQPSVSAA